MHFSNNSKSQILTKAAYFKNPFPLLLFYHSPSQSWQKGYNTLSWAKRFSFSFWKLVIISLIQRSKNERSFILRIADHAFFQALFTLQKCSCSISCLLFPEAGPHSHGSAQDSCAELSQHSSPGTVCAQGGLLQSWPMAVQAFGFRKCFHLIFPNPYE